MATARQQSDYDEIFSETDESIKRLSPDIKTNIKFPSCRHVLALMAFLGFVNVYCLRVNLSVALVDMVNSSYIQPLANTSDCPGHHMENHTDTQPTGEFNWDTNLQGLVLGAFFYGYITTQLLGGWLAEKFGAKWLFGFGVLCTSVLTLLTPVVARLNVYLFIAVRVLEGIGEGVTFPAMHAMLSNWVPPLDRSRFVTFIYAGAQIGTVVASPVSGLLCKYGFAGGWPSVFYVFGSLGILWFLFWTVLCYDTPEKHPRISWEERRFIEKAIGPTKIRKLPTPWLSIFSSGRVWVLVIAHFSNNWGYYTLLTCLPTYMREVLRFDISQNGFVSGLPYLFTWIFMAGGGQVADLLRQRKILSTTAVRKLFNTTGQLLPAVCLIATGYLGCDTVLAVVMVTAAVGLSGIAMSGYGVNHLDLAPPFAGTLMGLTNGFATIPGFVGPQVVGALTKDNPTRGQWQIVFFISAAVYLFGSMVYLLFGTGEEQPWARPQGYALIQEEPLPQGQESSEDNNDDEILTFNHQTLQNGR